MYPFLFLAPVLSLALGQTDGSEPPADPPPAAEPSSPQPETMPATEPQPSGGRPARGENPTRPAAAATAAPGRRPAEPEKTQVARAALAFLDALVAADAEGLASASAERFSFDGDVRTGREAIRQTWRGLLAGRDAPQRPTLLDLELLPSAEAVSRLGPPPPRLAPLVKGTWVGIANLSRRPVVLFLAREGARWVAVGMQ